MCCIGCFLAIWISFLEQWDVWGLRGQLKNTALVVHSVTWHWLMRVRTWAEFDRERRGNWRTWGHQKEEGKEMTERATAMPVTAQHMGTASGGNRPAQGQLPEMQPWSPPRLLPARGIPRSTSASGTALSWFLLQVKACCVNTALPFPRTLAPKKACRKSFIVSSTLAHIPQPPPCWFTFKTYQPWGL